MTRFCRPLLIIAMLFSALSARAASDEELAVQVLTEYQRAFVAGDASAAVKRLGVSFFVADERSGGSPRVSAHMFKTGATLAAWPANYLKEAGPHVNVFQVVSVSVRGDAAVIITHDTGHNRFRTWKDEEVTWLLGRTAGSWKIVGMIIRDIQLPQ